MRWITLMGERSKWLHNKLILRKSEWGEGSSRRHSHTNSPWTHRWIICKSSSSHWNKLFRQYLTKRLSQHLQSSNQIMILHTRPNSSNYLQSLKSSRTHLWLRNESTSSNCLKMKNWSKDWKWGCTSSKSERMNLQWRTRNLIKS